VINEFISIGAGALLLCSPLWGTWLLSLWFGGLTVGLHPRNVVNIPAG
jgi:uncharacterized membrane protein HdeD (DUF308 family)